MTEYQKALERNSILSRLKEKLEEGDGTSKDLDKAALIAGSIAGELMAAQLEAAFPNGQIPEADVRTVVSPIMKENFAFVVKVAALLQNEQFRQAGIGLKAVAPEYDIQRENELVAEISRRSFEDGFIGSVSPDDGNKFQKIRR